MSISNLLNEVYLEVRQRKMVSAKHLDPIRGERNHVDSVLILNYRFSNKRRYPRWGHRQEAGTNGACFSAMFGFKLSASCLHRYKIYWFLDSSLSSRTPPHNGIRTAPSSLYIVYIYNQDVDVASSPQLTLFVEEPARSCDT